MQGVIKKIVSDRGFGFISAEQGDVFFHVSSCQDLRFDDLQVGQTVEYDLDEQNGEGRSDRGPRATSVRSA